VGVGVVAEFVVDADGCEVGIDGKGLGVVVVCVGFGGGIVVGGGVVVGRGVVVGVGMW
jgi:hypothetical protein